jgi:hypothetical protein
VRLAISLAEVWAGALAGTLAEALAEFFAAAFAEALAGCADRDGFERGGTERDALRLDEFLLTGALVTGISFRLLRQGCRTTEAPPRPKACGARSRAAIEGPERDSSE